MFASVRTWAERWGEAPSDVFTLFSKNIGRKTPFRPPGFLLRVVVCGWTGPGCGNQLDNRQKPQPQDGCPMFASVRTWAERRGEAPSDVFTQFSKNIGRETPFRPCTPEANMGHPSWG